MDIKNIILNQLPEGAMDTLIEKTGVDKGTVEKIMDAGIPEVVKEGTKTEGGIFDNLEETVLTKAVASQTGIEEGIVAKVIAFALPFLKEKIDSKELMAILGGLSDGFGMDDLQNIAGAIMTDSKSSKSTTPSHAPTEKQGGFLGNILGGLFGKK